MAQQRNTGTPSVQQAISNEMIQLYKQRFGRGPTLARTHWCTDDVIAVVLENTLTSVERSLVDLDQHQRLRDLRNFFQYASRDEFVAIVERHTGRTVRSFVSGVDTFCDGLSVEAFVLEPVEN